MKWGAGSKWGAGTKWGIGVVSVATPDDYGLALRQLLPRGVVWTDDPARKLSLLLLAFGSEFSRVHNRLLDLVEEADPRTTSDLIGDWERAFGLPDPCDPTPPTLLSERRLALVARMVETGGQSPAYYIEVAAGLGVVITITEQQHGVALRVGTGRVGGALGAVMNIFYWQVNAPAATSASVRARMECIFQRIKPAHTVVEFVY